jgi:molybdopterin converting factor subunit 1
VTIEVLLFAQARERAGVSRLALELPEGSRVGDALDAVVRAHPGLAPLVPSLAVAVNGVLARTEAPLHPGGELALLPPVSGG